MLDESRHGGTYPSPVSDVKGMYVIRTNLWLRPCGSPLHVFDEDLGVPVSRMSYWGFACAARWIVGDPWTVVATGRSNS